MQWTANGVAVSLASSGQIAPKLVSDGNGNSILAWLDSRDALTTEVDLYAQWVSSSGTLGVPTGVENEPHVRPGSFRLDQNVPNPFNPSTTISYLLPTRSRVTLEVYNVLGRRVVTLVQGVQGPGVQRVTVDARTWASGVYYYRIESHALDRGESLNFVDTRKFVLIR